MSIGCLDFLLSSESKWNKAMNENNGYFSVGTNKTQSLVRASLLINHGSLFSQHRCLVGAEVR